MKIKLERNGIEVSLKVDCDMSKKETSAIIEALYEATNQFAKGIKGNQEKEEVDCSNTLSLDNKKEFIPTTTERPAFRDRLPNNVVDVKDLTIEQAVKENTLVRCPHCGQAHAIIVHSNGRMYMMRKDYTKKEFVSITEWEQSDTTTMDNCCCKDDTDKHLYFEDLQNIPEDSSIGDFFVNNQTEIFCPVCHKSENFENWKKAYDMPLDFFETEHLCDACGGETVTNVLKDTKIIHCEKCGLEQEVPNE